MTLYFTDAYHTGYVVRDIHAAMDELGEALQLRWARLQERRMSLRTAEGETTPVLRYTYSMGEQPPYLELLEHVDGTPWEVSQGPGRIHHFGFWAADLVGESERLERLGAPLVVTYAGAQGPSGFAYHRLPSGLLIELVDEARRPTFERWFAGGELTGDRGTGRPGEGERTS